MSQQSRGMNGNDQPATEQQLSCLKEFGFIPDSPLSKVQASELIHRLREHAQAAPPPEQHRDVDTVARRLRHAVENAARVLAEAEADQIPDIQADLEEATAARREFWLDTCREITRMRSPSLEVMDLYRQYGCRFESPGPHQAQEVLDALDSVMPLWDRDHPELFYQTLELNYPILVRRV